ncbi:cation efflux family-domain-containing protein [Dipodascopsis tothii]|uniref:cation efflux family-domain-containing protein n=1 Tax=Dipodascopsis tothii TaxID=44089 RepID=UPI0034CFA2F0
MSSPLFRRSLSSEPQYIQLSSSPRSRRASLVGLVGLGEPSSSDGPDLFSFGPPPSKLERLDSLLRMNNLQELRPQHLIGTSRPTTDWAAKIVVEDDLCKMSKPLREFYEKQNELIERYREIDRLLDSKIPEALLQTYSDEVTRRQRQDVPANVEEEGLPLLGHDTSESHAEVRFAILLNFGLNVVLLLAKAAVTLLSNSLSVVASLVDSALDFLSTAIIWTTAAFVQSRNWRLLYAYPVGRSRLEPIGVLVFSIIMIVSFIQVLIEAFQRLLHGAEEVDVGVPSLVIMLLTVLSKLGAYLWCRSVRSSSVQALAQDAMTDVIFNSFSILFPIVAHYGHLWWFDALGAIFLAVYVIVSWASTSLEHVRHLTGAQCDSIDHQVVLYLCTRFAETVRYVSGLNAYYAGDRINVEVDIIIDDKMTLRDGHDIGEALQYAIETLPIVERAFVHLDYRRDNFAGHIPR